ncbi:MAG: toll/interleukin-1 receptor domain-containing protein, partial [Pseudomonadota bacterium]
LSGLARPPILIVLKKPAEVNSDIGDLVDSLRKPKEPPEPAIPPVDYFISYSGEDEPIARQIAAVLDDLGKTYLVQYRDFPQSNFVNMMNEAMERAERLIPVYSKNYVASDFCKAEWNHYFKLDPSGAERRIVGFKLDGADLTPLMDQIVYESLSSTPRADWPELIRNWISWEPLPLNRANVEKTTTTILDPGVDRTKADQLHTAPTAERNTPEIPTQLANAMASLRMMLELVTHCKQNMSGMMQGSLELYEFYLDDGGDQPSWDGLDRYVAVLSEGSLSMSGAELREEKKALEQFIVAHNKCLDARKQAPYDERELAHVPLTNATSEAIDEFIDRLKTFRETALARDAVTEDYDRQAENLIKQGRDFAFEAGALDAETKPDTARKRFLRYVGGFAIKTLSILGSIASIRSSPEGTKLLEAAERLVEKFYEMVGL